MPRDLMPDLTALGSKAYIGLETFEHRAGLNEVELTSDELTAVCPVTGQPDIYGLVIRYWPEGRCLESKSLKLYLTTFRNEGIFCEDLAVEIAEAIRGALGCRIEVSVIQKARGGISITARA